MPGKATSTRSSDGVSLAVIWSCPKLQEVSAA